MVEEGLESRSFADDESTEDVFISINANVRKNMQIHCNENKVKHNNEYTTHACLKMKKVSLVNTFFSPSSQIRCLEDNSIFL